ncbi:hypothetical protein KL86DES1_20406 [uncultured Desulfovibrio sp.]|uniref:Uncharacterized protein n=1 Tax=uncultured Desulfovibrio sp. TaxID=167968 RepID=A0A212L3N4_9BACT|nr:hypothetical protein KL86DES1_20406 [uncultured Desulfovibrio sp.]VZH33309.1 conserved protein of unknown function [Desulfovibrio sp. 86]
MTTLSKGWGVGGTLLQKGLSHTNKKNRRR